MAENGGGPDGTGASLAVPGGRSSTPDVFISYASADGAVAAAVCTSLERDGLTCWIAPRDVTPGASYAGEIVRAIDAAKAVVLVLSQNAAASPHVLREVERGTSKRHPVVSLRIDQAPLPADLEYFLNTSQWLDASGGDSARAMPKLVVAVRWAISTPTTADPRLTATPAAGAFTPASHAPRNARPPNRTAIVIASLTGLVLAGLAAHWLWLSSRGSTSPPAASIAGATRATTPSTPAIAEKSIAVLPFADLSEKHDQEYFADGMAEEILDVLATIPALRVISRTSSFQFKGHNEDIRTIGRSLGASYVLEGSVRRSEEKVRVTAQLINAQDGTHLWSSSYDRDLHDVLGLQQEVATQIARELQLSVGAFEDGPRQVSDPRAYEFYLRARASYELVNQQGFDDAAAYLQRALELDPKLTRAAAMLALISAVRAEWGFVPVTAGYAQARREAEAALRLDPNSAVAHAVLGRIHLLHDWDWAAADRETKAALALEPNNLVGLYDAAQLAAALGRSYEAGRLANAALLADPLFPGSHVLNGWCKYLTGHYADAVSAYRRALQISATYVSARFFLGQALIMQGDAAGALVAMQGETPEGGRDVGLVEAYWALGRKAESDAALATALREHADDTAYELAQAYAFRGEANKAFESLQRAYAMKSTSLWQLKGDPLLKALAADPRYKTFLRKMNLPE